MKRLSLLLEDLADDINGTAGKYMNRRHNSEAKDRLIDVPKEIVWCNIQAFLEGSAQILEYLVAKPMHYAENALLGKIPSSA